MNPSRAAAPRYAKRTTAPAARAAPRPRVPAAPKRASTPTRTVPPRPTRNWYNEYMAAWNDPVYERIFYELAIGDNACAAAYARMDLEAAAAAAAEQEALPDDAVTQMGDDPDSELDAIFLAAAAAFDAATQEVVVLVPSTPEPAPSAARRVVIHSPERHDMEVDALCSQMDVFAPISSRKKKRPLTPEPATQEAEGDVSCSLDFPPVDKLARPDLMPGNEQEEEEEEEVDPDYDFYVRRPYDPTLSSVPFSQGTPSPIPDEDYDEEDFDDHSQDPLRHEE